MTFYEFYVQKFGRTLADKSDRKPAVDYVDMTGRPPQEYPFWDDMNKDMVEFAYNMWQKEDRRAASATSSSTSSVPASKLLLLTSY